MDACGGVVRAGVFDGRRAPAEGIASIEVLNAVEHLWRTWFQADFRRSIDECALLGSAAPSHL